jgi:hypothetical protein
MKTAYQTVDGTYLVELTSSEYRALDALQQALDGSVEYWTNAHGGPRNVDMPDASKVFDAIRLWAATKFDVNRMQASVDTLKKAVEPGTGDAED